MDNSDKIQKLISQFEIWANSFSQKNKETREEFFQQNQQFYCELLKMKKECDDYKTKEMEKVKKTNTFNREIQKIMMDATKEFIETCDEIDEKMLLLV